MSQIVEVPLHLLVLSKHNVRKDLAAGQEDAGIDELAQSIRSKGLISPLTVRKAKDGRYEVISGQRRMAACKKIGLDPVRCIVRDDLTDSDAAAISLIENVHRADMNPMDKAHALHALYETHGSYEAVSKEVALTPETIKRYVRLLQLPEELQNRIGTDGGAVRIGALSQLAGTFEGDDAVDVWDKISGFSGKIAETIIRRSGGDLDAIDGLVIDAQEGAFNTPTCGGKFDCEVVRDLLEGEMTQADFHDLLRHVAERLDVDISKARLGEATKALWKVLARS